MSQEQVTKSVDDIQNTQVRNKDSVVQDNGSYDMHSEGSNGVLEAVISEVPISNVSKNICEKSKSTKRSEFTIVYANTIESDKIGGPLNYRYENDQPGPQMQYDPETRNGFVRLVLSLVLIMLIVTAAFVTFVLMTPVVKEFFQTVGWFLALFALALLIGLNYAVACSECVRYPPGNYILLVLTVIACSLIAAQVTCRYRTEIILYAVIATAAVVFVCILLACSKFDFTSWLLYIVVIATAFSVLAMIVLTTMLITGTVMKPVLLVILFVGTLLEVIILTTELQTVIGGKSIELAEDEYALGAYFIYTSIISIFLKLVQIIGLLDD